MDDEEAELLVLDENLKRMNLKPADVAEATARSQFLNEKINERSRAGAAQAAGMNRALGRGDVSANLAPTSSYAESISQATGRSVREVERAARRGRELAEHIPSIRGTSLDRGVEMDALIQRPEPERRELTGAQKIAATARVKALYLEKHPETAHGGASRWNGTANFATPSFVTRTASATGQSERAIWLDVARGEALADVLPAVEGTSLDSGVELDALIRRPEPERRELVARAAAGERVSAREPRASAILLNTEYGQPLSSCFRNCTKHAREANLRRSEGLQMLKFALFPPIVLIIAGCVSEENTLQVQAKSDYQLGKERCETSNLLTHLEKAKCMNNALRKTEYLYADNKDLLDQMMTQREVLSAKIDRHELTKEEANFQFAQFKSGLVDQENQRLQIQEGQRRANTLAALMVLQGLNPAPQPAPVYQVSTPQQPRVTTCTSTQMSGSIYTNCN